MKCFNEYVTENKQEELNEDYKSDTKKYIDKILKDVDDAGAKKFLEGLKKFVDENGFLTSKQRKGLAQFHSENPNKK